MNKKLSELLGWYGVIAILMAYGLNSFEVVTASNWLYLLLNVTGGVGIGVDAWRQRNYQPVVLNVVWVSIALLGLVKGLF